MPVALMIVGGILTSFITSITSDDEYIKKASANPIVNQYLDSYPNYSSSQHNEFLGWRVIYFDTDGGPSLYVKVSNLHGGIKVSAACSTSLGYSFSQNVTLTQKIVDNGC